MKPEAIIRIYWHKCDYNVTCVQLKPMNMQAYYLLLRHRADRLIHQPV
jgi:hypothetical protein